MSQENVEIVRRAFEAGVREDWTSASAAFDPDVEWVEMPSLGPDASTYTGFQEARKAIESWMGMWSEYGVEVALLDRGSSPVYGH